MKNILFIAPNDGSDTRINKEVISLSKNAYVYYIGIGEYKNISFVQKHCTGFFLIPGKNNSALTIIKQILKAIRILISHKISSIHFINEHSFIFFYPFIWNKYVVLDLFDSIFLTLNKPKNQWSIIKRIIYLPVNKVIVTDENRRGLLPDFLNESNKVVVLENFPNYFSLPKKNKEKNNKITILYSGTLMERRGTNILFNLVNKDHQIKIICAGWIKDYETKKLINHPSVNYLGIMKQEELLKITAHQCDYILSVYEPLHMQNINASPNKIYDSIMCDVPSIINNEVKISSFVKEENIGIVLNNYYNIDYNSFIEELKTRKDTFIFSNELKYNNSWNMVESRLLKAHGLLIN